MKLLLLLSLLVAPLSAAPERREVEASFYCFAYVPGLETVRIPGGQGPVALRLSTANLSAPAPVVVTDGEALLSRNDAGATPAAKIRIPAGLTKALVVLLPAAPGSPEPYRSFVLDHGREQFPLGTYRLVNLSPHAIRGAVGRSYAEARPGGTAGLELKGEAGEVQPLKFEFQENGRWSRLTESRAAVRRDRRWLVCVYQDAGTRRMNLRSIPDRDASEPETLGAATVSTR